MRERSAKMLFVRQREVGEVGDALGRPTTVGKVPVRPRRGDASQAAAISAVVVVDVVALAFAALIRLCIAEATPIDTPK